MKKFLFTIVLLLGCGQMFGQGQVVIDDILITDPSCSDSCNGEIVIIASGGIPPMEYSIDNGQTFQTSNSFTGLCAGMYDAVAQDVGGEQFHQPADLIATPIGANFTIDSILSCQGDTDGVLTVNAYGGFGGSYTYLWVSDQTTDVTNYSGHSGYNVVVITDLNGCTDSMQVYLDEPILLEVSLSSVNTVCTGAIGSSEAFAEGGTMPYDYSWESGGTGLIETNLTEGDYIFTVTDANGCIASATANIEIDPGTLDVSVLSVNTTCSNAIGSSEAFPIGGTMPLVYSWESGGTGLTESNLAAGDYILTVTDANGCVATDTANIGIDVIPIEVCVVTVDSTSTKNVIVWEKPIANGISHFNVYRDVVGTYTYVDSVPYDSLSQYEDVTGGVNPQVTQYRYKISVVDSCGNESDLSAFHQTIHLNAPNLVGNTADLVWQAYGGFTSNFYYRILRDSTGTNDWEVVDSVSLTTLVYTDIAVPNTSNISYLVQIATPNTCTSTKAQDHNTTRSNRHTIEPPNPNTINESTLLNARVQPNPSNGLFTIIVEASNWNYSLFDMSGKLISTEMVSETNKEIDIQTIETGIYLMKISLDDSFIYKKIIKQ